MPEVSEPFELRSASMTLLAFVLRSVDLDRIEASLTAQLGDGEQFSEDAVMLDLAPVEGSAAVIDFGRLTGLLRRHRLLPVAVRGGSPAQMAAALQAGLAAAPSAPAGRDLPTPRAASAAETSSPAATPATPGATAAAQGEGAPATVDVAAAIEEPSDASTGDAARPSLRVAMVVDRPLRSGQQVYARGGDLVVLAAVNFGAEVIADGSIHVYAPLRGKAIAGAKGNQAARIFSTCLDAELVAIAGTYRTTENPLPSEVAGKPAQIRLDGERLVFEPLG